MSDDFRGAMILLATHTERVADYQLENLVFWGKNSFT